MMEIAYLRKLKHGISYTREKSDEIAIIMVEILYKKLHLNNISTGKFNFLVHNFFRMYIFYFAPLIVLITILIHKSIFSQKGISVRPESQISKAHFSIMIDMLVPPERAIDMQANLSETFPLWVERHGLAAAHRIRKMQIARLIVGEYWNKMIELIKAVKLVGS